MRSTIIIYSFILVAVTAVQCRKANSSSTVAVMNTTTPYPTNSVKTFLALGDSYTIGQSVQAGERFPARTIDFLRANSINMGDPRYVATTGWTTDDLDEAITNQQITGPYSIVTLLIGVNDQYQRHDTTGYRERFRNLLMKSIQFAGSDRNRVFVLSIPDYSVTPFATYSDTAFIRKQIDQFNNINKEETIQAHCHYLDITPSTRQALTDPTLIANDGLHPSGKEYTKWAGWLTSLMLPVLK